MVGRLKWRNRVPSSGFRGPSKREDACDTAVSTSVGKKLLSRKKGGENLKGGGNVEIP